MDYIYSELKTQLDSAAEWAGKNSSTAVVTVDNKTKLLSVDVVPNKILSSSSTYVAREGASNFVLLAIQNEDGKVSTEWIEVDSIYARLNKLEGDWVEINSSITTINNSITKINSTLAAILGPDPEPMDKTVIDRIEDCEDDIKQLRIVDADLDSKIDANKLSVEAEASARNVEDEALSNRIDEQSGRLDTQAVAIDQLAEDINTERESREGQVAALTGFITELEGKIPVKFLTDFIIPEVIQAGDGAENTYTVKTNTDQVINFTVKNGSKGSQGEAGPQGLAGNGIETIEKTGTAGLVDTYTIMLSNGDTVTFTVTNGAAGPQGPQGNPGTGVTIKGSYETLEALKVAHPAGENGDSYLVGGDLYVWDPEHKEWCNVGNIQGPTGPKGDPGEKGNTGAQGNKGEAGKDGADGTTPQLKIGEDNYWYVSYDNGATWTSLGVKATGDKGDTGETGAPGEKGEKGDQGIQGPQGEVGPQGPQGEVGPQGPKGADGAVGPTGPKGDIGTGVNIKGSFESLAALQAAHPTGEEGDAYLIAGNLYVWTGSEWLGVGNIQGPTGLQGEKGDKGDKGDIGPTGPQGIQGIQGKTGPQGERGEQGPTGIEGPMGPTGPRGETGPQGERGATGPKGADGAAGPTGAVGPTGPAISTYKIKAKALVNGVVTEIELFTNTPTADGMSLVMDDGELS